MQDKFKKFKLFQSREESLIEGSGITMLINLDHLVSVKPINVPTAEGVVKAYWLRLANGKKYKAIQIPEELASMLDHQNSQIVEIGNDLELQADLH